MLALERWQSATHPWSWTLFTTMDTDFFPKTNRIVFRGVLHRFSRRGGWTARRRRCALTFHPLIQLRLRSVGNTQRVGRVTTQPSGLPVTACWGRRTLRRSEPVTNLFKTPGTSCRDLPNSRQVAASPGAGKPQTRLHQEERWWHCNVSVAG